MVKKKGNDTKEDGEKGRTNRINEVEKAEERRN